MPIDDFEQVTSAGSFVARLKPRSGSWEMAGGKNTVKQLPLPTSLVTAIHP